MNPMNKLLFALAFIIFPLAACGTGSLERGGLGTSAAALVQVDEGEYVPLLGGQDIEVGGVYVSVDGDDLVVTYATWDGWLLYETHLWVGEDLGTLPRTRSGNPIVGLFPWHSGDLEGVSSFSFHIPLDHFGLSADMVHCEPLELFIVSHAVVEKELEDGSVQGETAYGDGTRLTSRGNWATYHSFVLVCTDDEDDVVVGGSCETAFAYGDALATCFIGSENIDTARWGWYNGPLGPGSYYFDIYAAAGLCDLDKGTLVGWLEVEFDGSSAWVTYHMGSEFTMSETHLYVGSDPLPTNNQGQYTVAPGLYPLGSDLDGASSESFVIEDLDAEIYVVAHAVVCSEGWED